MGRLSPASFSLSYTQNTHLSIMFVVLVSFSSVSRKVLFVDRRAFIQLVEGSDVPFSSLLVSLVRNP
jgi:hypothetical protein